MSRTYRLPWPAPMSWALTGPKFCETCRVVSRILSESTTAESFQKREGFRASASHCQLCKLICLLIDKVWGDLDDWTDMICVNWERTSPKGRWGTWGGTSLISLRRDDYDTSDRELKLAVWCDEGSSTARLTSVLRRSIFNRPEANSTSSLPAELIATQRPIFTNNPLEASPLITRWLDMCSTHHRHCLQKMDGLLLASDEDVYLPTRVLCIGSITPEINVRLVETKNRRGRYCALSHCWGPENKRPLRTIQSNLNEHLVRIPSDKLPKTFKDALIITKSIGIDYLWIDSLCIVQDDLDDWERESVIMGSLYENATLVIAASSASDSTQGCCVAQRPEPIIVTLPLIDEEDRNIGQCHLSPLPFGEIDPVDSQLNKRAWAFQERYMSRRKVFFMPGGMVWACKGVMLDERSCIMNSSVEGHALSSWSDLLFEYTGKDITRFSDRLRAIEGIATAIATTEFDPYGNSLSPSSVDRGQYRAGVWENSMPAELIWVRASRIKRGRKLCTLPSWSWARTEGAKIWPLETDFAIDVEKTYDALSITSDSHLKIHGYLGMKSRLAKTGHSCVAIPVPVKEWITFTVTNVSPEPRFFWAAQQGLSQMILDDVTSPPRILGFALFDEQSVSSVIFSIIASVKRNENDRLQRGEHRVPMHR
ncbi:heterokaryon incompatibility protein-domain-containing protein [Nemania sp. NC0429]|nr:heterokaryon incompatibility protein-domain-containing protein [Nemania sp. NC0429]